MEAIAPLDELYEIHISKTKKRKIEIQYLVHYRGWSETFDEWVAEKLFTYITQCRVVLMMLPICKREQVVLHTLIFVFAFIYTYIDLSRLKNIRYCQ